MFFYFTSGLFLADKVSGHRQQTDSARAVTVYRIDYAVFVPTASNGP